MRRSKAVKKLVRFVEWLCVSSVCQSAGSTKQSRVVLLWNFANGPPDNQLDLGTYLTLKFLRFFLIVAALAKPRNSTVISRVSDSVCVCPCCRRKTAWVFNTKLRISIVHGRTRYVLILSLKDHRSKSRGYQVQTVWQAGASIPMGQGGHVPQYL